MKKISDFENNLKEIDDIIEKLETNELSLENSIKEYERAMKLIKSSSDILNKVEGKIIKVSKTNDDIELMPIEKGEI